MIEGAMSGAPCTQDADRAAACESDPSCGGMTSDDCAAKFPYTYKDELMTVIHMVIGIMGVLLIYVPISVATGPAEVSTECEKFFDELNNVRLLTLSPPIHARLGILETAISKMNRGQVTSSSPHPHHILTTSSPHPHLILITSSPHPHHILRCLILTQS